MDWKAALAKLRMESAPIGGEVWAVLGFPEWCKAFEDALDRRDVLLREVLDLLPCNPEYPKVRDAYDACEDKIRAELGDAPPLPEGGS